MSTKNKLKKLQLPKLTRSNSAVQIPNSQISKFFCNNIDSNSNSEGNIISGPPSIEKDESNNVILILSDEDSNTTDSSNKLSDNKCLNTVTDEKLPVKNSTLSQSSTSSTSNTRNSLRIKSKEENQLSLQADNVQQIKVPALRTKISRFFNDSINDDAFETPYIQAKKSRLSDDNSTAGAATSNKPKLPAKRKKKKQPTIKSVLSKNEEIFSDIMAQHSIADNFNPDEIQMALALSMSENQESNILCEDLNDENKSQNLNIRNKLEVYGFKTGAKKDYNLDFYIPVVNKKKSKWANRFTALTLRNSEKQLEKLNNNVEIYLNSQNNVIQNLDFGIQYEYETCSRYLQNLQTNYEFIKNCNFVVNEKDIANFYITELFSPSTAKITSLMKKYENIPGRSVSPKKKKKSLPIREEIHVEIELNEFNQKGELKDCCESCVSEEKIEHNLNVFSDSKETTNKKLFTEIVVNSAINIENEPKIFMEDESKISELIDCDHSEVHLSSPYKDNKKLNRSIRSPDLFSDFDISTENIDEQEISFTDNIESNITHFEKFSSDEVKIFHNNLLNDSSKISSVFLEENTNMSDGVIDLTQEDKFVDYSLSSQHLNQTKESKESILTQDINTSESDCIILSDDEVNYSMALVGHVKKNKTVIYDTTYDGKEFSIMELIEDENKNSKNFSDNEKHCIDIESSDNFQDKKISPYKNKLSVENKMTSINTFNKNRSFKNSSPKYRRSISDSFSNFNNNNASINFTRKSFQHNDNEFNEDYFSFPPVEIIDCCDENIGQNNSSQIGNDLNDSKISDEIRNQSIVDDEFDLTKLRNEFGIEKSPPSRKTKKSLSESITSNYSLPSICKTYNTNIFDDILEVEDELNFLADSSSKRLSISNVPKHLDILLTADIISSSSDDGSNDSFNLTTLPRKFGTNIKFDDILEVEEELNFLADSSSKPSSISVTPKKLDKLLTADIISSSSDDGSNDSFNLTKLQRKFGIDKTPKTKLFHKTLSESTVFSSNTKCQPSTSLKRHLTNIVEDALSPAIHSSLPKVYNSANTLQERLTEIIRNSDYTHEPKEILIENKTYSISTRNVPEKLDYKNMDLTQIHEELDKYGIKPLKKKQGVIILDYIYNQMHPYIIENETQINENELINKSIVGDNAVEKSSENSVNTNYNLKDCFGDILCTNDGLLPELRNEKYIFQTNVSKKKLTALLPLHIAWYNLIKSNNKLRETILNYKPIDLQVIYLFFKSIGYRYDPKDIKRFFDDRCIIFRLDLSETTNNRHVKKRKQN